MAVITVEQAMAKDRKNLPVRIDEESIKWGKIAASYKDMTLSDYVSVVVLEAAKRDVELSHAEITKAARKPTPAAAMGLNDGQEIDVPMPKPKRNGGR